MIQNLIFTIFFLKNVISGIQVFYITPVIRAFFILDFLAESLKDNKN